MEAAVECLAVAGDFVVGGNKKLVAWGTSTYPLGVGSIQSPDATDKIKSLKGREVLSCHLVEVLDSGGGLRLGRM